MKIWLAKIWKILRLPKNFQLHVMRFMQSQFLVGVTGIIFNDNNEVLLFKHTYRQVEWSLPGGYLASKEHPTEGLEREVEEECGLIVSGDHQMMLRTDRDTARLDIVIIGTFIGGTFKPSSEVIEYGFFAFDELPDIMKKQVLLIHKAMQLNSVNKSIKRASVVQSSKVSDNTIRDKIFSLFKRKSK
ncbi:MAG: NUDIX domain-containing protein [Candidatus Roizmanbacteria bacterium]